MTFSERYSVTLDYGLAGFQISTGVELCIGVVDNPYDSGENSYFPIVGASDELWFGVSVPIWGFLDEWILSDGSRGIRISVLRSLCERCRKINNTKTSFISYNK